MDDDTLICYGGEVKALGNGRVGGMLVVFGSAETPDLSTHRDYFTKSTDFWHDFSEPVKSPVLYHHGFDPTLKRRRIGVAELKMTDAGVWAEAQLKLADDYEKKIMDLIHDNKLKWSSGSASHLVERKAMAEGIHEVLSWPLGIEASLTPTPAEPRTVAVALKSLIEHDEPGAVPASLVERSRRAVSDAQEIADLLGHFAGSRAAIGRGLGATKAAEVDAMIAAYRVVMANLEALRPPVAPMADPAEGLMAEYYALRVRDLAGRR